jgi:hypothetical protein
MSRNEEFVNGTYINEPGNGDFSIFHGTGENSVGTQSGALLKIEGPTGSFRDYNDLARSAERYGEDPTENEAAFPAVRDDDGNRIYRADEYGDNHVVRQGVLFEDSRKAPKVDLLAATKDARAHIPSLLEAANNKSKALWGQNVQHSDNLSDYSLPVVNRLIRAGLSPGPEIKETGNNYDWKTAHDTIQNMVSQRNHYWDDSDTETLSPEEFSQGGRTFARRLLAAEKARGVTQKSKNNEGLADPATFGLATGKGKGESRLENFQPTLPGYNLPPDSFRSKDNN